MNFSHFRRYKDLENKIEVAEMQIDSWQNELDFRMLMDISEDDKQEAAAALHFFRESLRVHTEMANRIVDVVHNSVLNDIGSLHIQNSLEKDCLSWTTDEHKKEFPKTLLHNLPVLSNEMWYPSDFIEQQRLAETRQKRLLQFTSEFWNLWSDTNRTEALSSKPYWKEQMNIAFQNTVARKACIICHKRERDMLVLADKPNHVLCPHQLNSVCVCTNKLHPICSSCTIASLRENFLTIVESFLKESEYLPNYETHLLQQCSYCCRACKGSVCAFQLIHIPSRKNIENDKGLKEDRKKGAATTTITTAETLNTVHTIQSLLRSLESQLQK